MSESTLNIVNLNAGYGGIPVVRSLNIHVNPGEVVALLGPNGAGKTTTLLTISGILKPIAGDIQLLGSTTIGERPEKIARRGLAHVAEDRSLFFDLTVQERTFALVLRATVKHVARLKRTHSTCSRHFDHSSAVALGCCQVASSRCWPWPAGLLQNQRCFWSTK
jgi:ABC-type branched-subunit amino acid transport system ATPase component